MLINIVWLFVYIVFLQYTRGLACCRVVSSNIHVVLYHSTLFYSTLNLCQYYYLHI